MIISKFVAAKPAVDTRVNVATSALACQTRAMNDQEIESGAIREIEPEVRMLFTKLVERDPQEAAKMLEPYPEEFVVQMLELLNPASALKILQRFSPSRSQTILATASPETNKQWMRNHTYTERC